jgi:hypothetical protein
VRGDRLLVSTSTERRRRERKPEERREEEREVERARVRPDSARRSHNRLLLVRCRASRSACRAARCARPAPRPCDHDPLLLPPGERAERACSAVEHVEPGECACGGLTITGSLLRERAKVRGAAEEHVLGHRHPGRRRRLLGNDGDEAESLSGAAPRRAAREEIEPRYGRRRATARSRVVLPRRSGRSGRPLPFGDVEVDSVDDGPPPAPP